MVFWVAAARLYTTVEVGRDTVLISVMIELSTVCQLNMGNGIARFLPDLGRRSAQALAAMYVLTGGVALVLGTIFVLIAPSVSRQLSYLGNSTALGLGFVAALMLWGLFALQDAALMATRQAPYIPLKNGAFGVLKLIALPLLLTAGAVHGVFLAWALPMALLLIPVNLLVFRRAIPAHLANGLRQSSIARIGRQRVARFLAQDYLASIFTQATLTVLPLLVIAILGATQSAYFAMPFTIVLAFDTFAYSACSSLVVEGTLQHESLRTLTRIFARRVLALLMPAAALLALAAPIVMLPFGRLYAENGAGALRLLLCGSVFRAVTAVFSAVSRAQGRGARLALVEFALLVLVLGAAVPLAHSDGIEGVAAAWLGANAVICVAVIPLLLRFLREP
jgi:O-antigen/teichoic acid export membrane protein